MWRLLILFLSAALGILLYKACTNLDVSACDLDYHTAQNCEKSKFLLQPWDEFEVGLLLVYYTESPCYPYQPYYHFCEGSGWGNEEATVACRELGYSHGIGSK